jgi:hypothetical protein
MSPKLFSIVAQKLVKKVVIFVAKRVVQIAQLATSHPYWQH